MWYRTVLQRCMRASMRRLGQPHNFLWLARDDAHGPGYCCGRAGRAGRVWGRVTWVALGGWAGRLRVVGGVRASVPRLARAVWRAPQASRAAARWIAPLAVQRSTALRMLALLAFVARRGPCQ